MQRRSNKFNASCNTEVGRKAGALELLTERSEQVFAMSLQPCEDGYLPKPTTGIAFMLGPNDEGDEGKDSEI
jgi:hypothetical protein